VSGHEIWGTLGGRWYVTVFGAVFLWRALAHLGLRRTALYTAVAVGTGVLAENLSVSYGFPYTGYTFNPALRGQELWVGDAPLFVPLSYAFVAYFAFAAGRLIASGPWRTRASRTWQEVALGIMLVVWAVWILDPATRLGEDSFVGKVFAYHGPGFWFGLPLGSQLGFTLTAGALVLLLAWMARADPAQAVPRAARHPHLVALGTYCGQVVFTAGIAFSVGEDTLGGAAVLIAVPAALVTAVLWSNLRPRATPVVGRGTGSAATTEPELDLTQVSGTR
jgi:uncharacterized membrane protein